MSNNETEWYVAVMVVLCTVGDVETDGDTVDLQCRLIQARDPSEAFDFAMRLGPTVNQSYLNGDGQTVRWTFKGLHRLERLFDQELKHGAEVYSSLVRTPYRELVEDRESLWEFWLERNKHRKLSEVLNDE